MTKVGQVGTKVGQVGTKVGKVGTKVGTKVGSTVVVPIRTARKVVRPIDLTRRLLALLGPAPMAPAKAWSHSA